MTRIKWAVICALVVGAVGFVAGFFGPLLLTPDANQGPLLGIFITGPGGFLLGFFAGGLFAHRLEAWVRRSPRDSNGG